MQCCSPHQTFQRIFKWHKWLRMTPDTPDTPNTAPRVGAAGQGAKAEAKPRPGGRRKNAASERFADLMWMLEDVGRCWKMLEGAKGSCMLRTCVYRTFWMALQYLEVPGVMTKNLTRHFESKPLGSGNHNGAATCVLIEFKTQFSW